MPQHPDRKLRVLLCGYGHLGMALLEGLQARARDCEVVGVFRWSSRPESRQYREPAESLFQRQILRGGLLDIRCAGVNSFAFTALLQELRPDVILVGSWGEIFQRHLLEQPDLLLINCHPSLLPAHRGPNPYASVILQGETQTGVTFHRMSARIDAGAIILQKAIPLTGEETGAGVRDLCVAEARRLIDPLLDYLVAHVLQGAPLPEIPQDESRKSYFPLLKPEDARIDWQADPQALARRLRAMNPWMAVYSYLDGKWPVLLHAPRVTPLRETIARNVPAGAILHSRRGMLQVALEDPAFALEAEGAQLAALGYPSFWPAWLSQMTMPWILRSGRLLMDPPPPPPPVL